MFINSASKNEEPLYASGDNDDSADEECLSGNEPFKNDVLVKK